jgi:hypothetical protein
MFTALKKFVSSADRLLTRAAPIRNDFDQRGLARVGSSVYMFCPMTLLKSQFYGLAAIFALPLLFAWSLPAVAQGKALGTYRDWSAQTFSAGGKIVCSMWSQPTKAEGKYTRRGVIYVFVTHRPTNDRLNELSFEAGYTFKSDSDVSVVIGGERFALFTKDSTAWNRTTEGDEALVKAMRSGSRMVVKGTSSRGTLTTDTYSLSGFSAAHNAINGACKVP